MRKFLKGLESKNVFLWKDLRKTSHFWRGHRVGTLNFFLRGKILTDLINQGNGVDLKWNGFYYALNVTELTHSFLKTLTGEKSGVYWLVEQFQFSPTFLQLDTPWKSPQSLQQIYPCMGSYLVSLLARKVFRAVNHTSISDILSMFAGMFRLQVQTRIFNRQSPGPRYQDHC